MPVMYNTGDWFTLRPGKTYRKTELYSLDRPRDIDLEHMTVCGAPFGGPIAIIRDFKKVIPVRGSPKPVIRIINSAGNLISTINWNHGNLVTMGWSDSEELLCVQNDGLVVIYDMFGIEKHTFSMGQEASDTKVIDAKIYASSAGTGVAVMTTNFRIFLINNVKEPKKRQLPEILNDNEVARKITEKFKNPTVQGISFCNIAEKAHSVGRNDLAIKLLELESKASLQVPLLLKLGEGEKALYSATKSGDTNLVYMVLLELKETTPLAKFQMSIRKFPMAQNLYKKYCQMYSKAALQDLFSVDDDFLSQAEFSLREIIDNRNFESSLPVTAASYTEARKLVEAELCVDIRKLLKQQKNLSEKYGNSHGIQFYGLSIHDTLKALLNIGDLKSAEKFKSEYKIPDKRYWWLRIQTLSEQFRWDELDKFSKIKKSPIGYEPFAEVCLKQNKAEEAKKYILRCRDDRRIKWYLRAKLYDDAAVTAYEQRDLQTLLNIHLIATNKNKRTLVEKLENYINQLSMKK